MRPLIGITTRLRLFSGSFGDQPTHTVAQLYTHAVWEAGGHPVLLPPTGDASQLVERIDGLVLAGGGDIEARLHGRQPHPTQYDVDPDRDSFEIGLVRGAGERGLPTLAVCRGVQVLNVALGGDLILDIPSEVGTSVVHRSGVPGTVATHPVRLAADSKLARLLDADELDVNSYHHQAVRRLAPGLRAVGWAADGVVEAVEPADDRWPCWGMQWHPEYRPPDNVSAYRPFEALIAAATSYTLKRNSTTSPSCMT